MLKHVFNVKPLICFGVGNDQVNGSIFPADSFCSVSIIKVYDSRSQRRWFSCILLWKDSDCWYYCKQRTLSAFMFCFPITLHRHAAVIQGKYGKPSVLIMLFIPLKMYYIDVTFIFSVIENNTLAARCVVAVWQIGWQRLLLANNHLVEMILENIVKTQSRFFG